MSGGKGQGDPRRPGKSIFLEHDSYRLRRLTDAARLLPIFGALLILVPLLWPQPEPGAAEAGVPMSRAILYIFAIWALLIVAAAGFALGLRKWGHERPEKDGKTG